MSRKNKRHKKKNSKNIVGTFLIAFVVAVVVSLTTFYALKTSTNNKIDKSTYCRTDGNTSITAILIDETDRLNSVQINSLHNELQKIIDEVPINERLEIYVVNKTKKHLLSYKLGICNPGRGKNANELYQNRKRIERQWEEKINKPLNEILSSLSDAHESKESPIFESIQSITITVFNHSSNQHAKHRRLIIASDMLQNTGSFNLYNQQYDFQQLKHSAYYRKARADLSDVEVKILLFNHDSDRNIQDSKFIQFWIDFFEEQGAILGDQKYFVKRISG